MIKAKKILFITQEMTPYVSESPLATLGRKVPQATQESNDKKQRGGVGFLYKRSTGCGAAALYPYPSGRKVCSAD